MLCCAGRDDKYTVMGAGTVAGLSLLFQPADTHRTLALYAWARVAQCWYNTQKASGKWHLWGSDWPHGDSLLFSLCSAQVMYAYAMRPDTLPPPYFQFIVSTSVGRAGSSALSVCASSAHSSLCIYHSSLCILQLRLTCACCLLPFFLLLSGPIQLPVLDAVKASHRGQPINLEALKAVYEKFAPVRPAGAPPRVPLEDILRKLSEDAYGKGASPLYPPLLPCSILHPQNEHCYQQWIETFQNGAKRSLPIYLSLTFVPMFILRFWLVVRHPLDQLRRGLWSVTRSTSFLSSFVATYMMIVCCHRKVFRRDHRALYWIAGFLASWTILLEQKSRRSELALYVLPRTIDSLVQTMQSRQMLAEVPHGEKILFATGMGALMYFRTYQPNSMSPFLKRVLNFLIPSSHSMPKDAGGVDLTATTTTPARGVAEGPLAIGDGQSGGSSSSSSVGGVRVSPLPSSDSTSRMRREDSDGLSAASIHGVIPLPSPGLSFEREQSFATTRAHPAAAAAPSPSPLALAASSDSLLASSLTPTPESPMLSTTATTTFVGSDLVVVGARADSFVAEKVVVLEQQTLMAEKEEAAQEEEQAEAKQEQSTTQPSGAAAGAGSNGHHGGGGKKRKGGKK